MLDLFLQRFVFNDSPYIHFPLYGSSVPDFYDSLPCKMSLPAYIKISSGYAKPDHFPITTFNLVRSTHHKKQLKI